MRIKKWNWNQTYFNLKICSWTRSDFHKNAYNKKKKLKIIFNKSVHIKNSKHATCEIRNPGIS